MKKILFILTAVLFTLTACESYEKRLDWNTAVLAAEDLTCDITVEQVNGHNGNLCKIMSTSPLVSYVAYGTQVVKAPSAEFILRQVGDNVITVYAINGDGTVIWKEFVVKCDELNRELPPLEVTICDEEFEITGNWDGNVCRWNQDYVNRDKYDEMKGKNLCIDVTCIGDCECSIRNGWWSDTYVDGIKLHDGKQTIHFTLTDAQIDECKEKDLNVIKHSGASIKVTRLYYSL